MTELKSLILKTMAAAGALLVMTSPASAYEPTARDLQQAAYAFLMGDWDYQFPMEGGETHLFFKNGAGSTYYSLVSLYPSERTGVFCDLMEVDSCRSRSLMSTFTVDCDQGNHQNAEALFVFEGFRYGNAFRGNPGSAPRPERADTWT